MYQFARLDIRVDFYELPALMIFNELSVVIDLRLVAGKLLLTVGGNTGVSCNFPLGEGVYRTTGMHRQCCGDSAEKEAETVLLRIC